jgi:uncharacterized protein involved in exopolysaccharide biosynthesis
VPDPRGPADDDADALFDIGQLRDSVVFVVGAVRRHWVAAIATFVLVFAAVATLANLWPKTYEVDGRLLMQRNEVMASLVNPGRTIPREAESPTQAASEIVLGRENVLALMKTTNLLEQWQLSRPPLLRFKDWLFGLFRSAQPDDERIDALAGLIEQRLQVGTSEEGAVSFFIRWPDRQMAYRLVDEAMKSFLEYRRATETAAITESIAILDRSIEGLEAQLNDTIAQLPRRPVGRTVVRRPPVRVTGPSAVTVLQLSRMKAALDERLQDIARMTGQRSQQLSEAQGRLTAALTIYTEGHPTVLALRQTVTQLSRDSPELTTARREARELQEQYDKLSVAAGAASDTQARAGTIIGELPAPALDPLSLVNLGDESEPVNMRLRVEMAQLAAVRERANAARAELSSAQAGFKYRYSVTRPPRVPRAAAGPNVTAIMLAGAVAGLLLGLVVPVAMRMLR